ncbi:MAG: ArnT family glycosyltransferase [Burkholderiaceae bacterium]
MIRSRLTSTQWLWLLIALVALARLALLGSLPLTDTTEARYAEIARKMVVLNDWVTPWFDNGIPFWGKPPLSFWLTAGSFKLLGISEFAARLPHWICMAIAACLTWSTAAKRSRSEALLAIAIAAGSLLFFVASGAVMTDAAFVLGTTLSMRGFWLGLHGAKPLRRREGLLFFVGLTISLMAKGPVGIVLIALAVGTWTLASASLRRVWTSLPWGYGVVLCALLVLPWYAAAELRTPGFLEYFLVGEHWYRFTVPGWRGDKYGSAHSFMRGSIWLFALFAVLPWPLLLPFAGKQVLPAASLDNGEPDRHHWRLYLWAWSLAPLVFFTAARNILWTYVLPALPAMAMLGAAWLSERQSQRRAHASVAAGLVATLALAAAALWRLPPLDQIDSKSTKDLIAFFQKARAPGEDLVFVGVLPYSASFYSQGEAKQVDCAAQLFMRTSLISAMAAVHENGVPMLEKSAPQAVRLVQYGDYVLFRIPRQDPAGAAVKPCAN